MVGKIRRFVKQVRLEPGVKELWMVSGELTEDVVGA